ncbi:RidA family protein [Kineococcus indalonis]|uniref:RidA family protein n=1 Tax=Kineococcus indalonis TaxID=2696566 RepID=UPI00141297AA|nr:RidA family protein [Kineococcus indalonis]NAZ86135.1 RidA family protein [Kineococcus indalonis]
MSAATHSERLAALGLSLPAVPAPVAAYVPAVRSGDLVHTSGQLPFTDGRLPLTGKVGQGDGLVDPGTAQQLAATCALNALAAAAGVAGGLDRIEAVVKVGVFVASDPAFTGQPAVANGASELLGQVLGDAGRHARSAVGVAVLPLDSPVEVEVTVRVRG